MKKRYLACVLVLAAASAAAAEKWIDLAASTDKTYSAKSGTFEIVTNKAGDEVVAVVGRVVNKKKDQTLVEKWYVRTADCRAGYGKLVTLTADGTFKFDNDFATDSGNVGSGIAESLCYFYEVVSKKQEEQGI